jgi:predicted O-methyltransferase YrrM
MLKHHLSINMKSFWQDLVGRIVQLGYDRDQVLCGSMPEETLSRLSHILSGNGLQIGGFVGVSHCYLAEALRGKGSICTIDPNLTHREIQNPFLVASKMVSHFGLSKNSTLICGYGNDQMRFFADLGVKFDFIILDGNHEYETVVTEIGFATPILKPGGYLVLDDIDYWDGPKKVYNETPAGYNRVTLDSRAGLLQKMG